MTERDLVLGVDLGGTRLRAAIAPVNGDGEAAPRTVVDTDAPASVDELADAIRGCLDASSSGGEVMGIAIAVPGLVDGTACTWIPNLPYLDGVDLSELVACPVVVANDAQASLLAEAVTGAAAGVSDAILLAIGTGIGSAVMADRRIIRGSHGGACSFGWACADVDDAGHDTSGWLERNAAGTALRQQATALGLHSAEALVDAARGADSQARHAVDAAAAAIGTTLAGAVGLLDPELIVIVGGVAEAFDVMDVPLRAALERQLPPHLRGVAVTTGTFGSNAGIHGAITVGRLGPAWWEIPA